MTAEAEKILNELRDELARIQEEIARREQKQQASRWCPHAPTAKQKEFLACDAPEVLYGGQVGGGKSDALLMDLLAYVDVPGYSCIAFRRTYTELEKAGNIMDRAADWLRPTGAVWNAARMRWTFPHAAGAPAKLSFGHMTTEKDMFEHGSTEYQRIAWDELTTFPGPSTDATKQPAKANRSYLFMHSRLRAPPNFPVKRAMRAGSNPGGPGHDWVFNRFVNPKTKLPGCVYIPAGLRDNPHIDAADYVLRLEVLDDTTKAQLLRGEWIRDDGGQLYRFTRERNTVDELPPGRDWHHVLGMDLGTSQQQPTTAYVLLAWSEGLRTVYVLKAKKFIAADVTETAEAAKKLAEKYEIDSIEMDAGGLGGGYVREFNNRHDLYARPAEKKDKLGARRLINGALERGEIKLLAGPDTEELAIELESLTWDAKGLDAQPGMADHLTDAFLYGWRETWAHVEYFTDVDPKTRPGLLQATLAGRRMEEIEAEEDEQLETAEREERERAWETME